MSRLKPRPTKTVYETASNLKSQISNLKSKIPITRKQKAGRFTVRPLFRFSSAAPSNPHFLWERQVLPQIVQFAWRASLRSVVALASKHPDESIRAWCGPDGYSTPPADDVIHERRAESVLDVLRCVVAVLVDVGDPLPPDPQPGTLLVFPDII